MRKSKYCGRLRSEGAGEYLWASRLRVRRRIRNLKYSLRFCNKLVYVSLYGRSFCGRQNVRANPSPAFPSNANTRGGIIPRVVDRRLLSKLELGCGMAGRQLTLVNRRKVNEWGTQLVQPSNWVVPVPTQSSSSSCRPTVPAPR